MRVFSAGIGTETNTFSPLPTGLDVFHADGYFPAGQHPQQMSRYSAPMFVARERGGPLGWTLLEGLFAQAQPAGLVSRQAYESLRDELLADLQQSLPVDIVLLGLHGAMVADGYDDCEADLIAHVRRLAGPRAIIGCELDPHAHLSEEMVAHADVLVAYKEYPHTDIKARAYELVDLCARAAQGEICPTPALVDTHMVVPIHTSRNPGRAFIDRISALEGHDGVLSISAIQGFATGDVACMGTKMLVYTDNDSAAAQALARQLADELLAVKEQLRVHYWSVDEAIDQGLASAELPAILADRADNPGSGAAGDSTFILRRLIERQVTGAVIGPLWDPVAVQLAMSAGVGARLALRVGGKISPLSGDPIDAVFTVNAVRKNHVMTGQAGETVQVGHSVLLQVDGVQCLLISQRTQAFHTDIFTGIGCDLSAQKMVVVKSAQHFYASFSQLSKCIVYVGAPGSATPRHEDLHYFKARFPKWPISEDRQKKAAAH